MLTHVVCWKYKPEIAETEREAHRAKLRALADIVPDIISFSVGADVLRLERSFDTGLVATYANRAGLEAYDAHPEHKAVAALGKQIAERVVSVDFESDEK